MALTELTEKRKAMAVLRIIQERVKAANQRYIEAEIALAGEVTGHRLWQETENSMGNFGPGSRNPYKIEPAKERVEARKTDLAEWEGVLNFTVETFIFGKEYEAEFSAAGIKVR